MANVKQVAKLRKSVSAWNKWRAKNATPVDLRNADLSNARLGSANLRSVDLEAANLQNADLAGADLTGANLRNTNLSAVTLMRANLVGAVMIDANLTDAVLSNANLNEAALGGANLAGAILYGSNFKDARLSGTIFGNTNLTSTEGLETCIHHGPSILDHSTIAQSGPLPLNFLRGCGLPENYITYLPSLLNQPIQFYSCFISYSTQDQPFADRLHADLQNAGVRCWFAPHDILPGQKIHEQIDEAIRLHDKLLLILSPQSMSSEWVKTEIAKARKRELTENRRMLFPLSLVPFPTLQAWECFDADTGKDSAREIREYFIPDFSTWHQNHASYQAAFTRLLQALQPKLTIAPAKAPAGRS